LATATSDMRSEARGSWASREVDGWYLGLSKDHYRCDLYFIPKTRAYRISGSTELFPQHCQLPCLTQQQHFRALTEELAEVVDNANRTPMGRHLIKNLQAKIIEVLQPPNVQEEQRVMREQEQWVIDNTPILTIPRITNAPAIIQSRNPTAKWALKTTPRIHRHDTRNNTPGALPLITKKRHDRDNEVQGRRRLPHIRAKLAPLTRSRHHHPKNSHQSQEA
jgi:hypothetical protein